jgi:hypothetical protein
MQDKEGKLKDLQKKLENQYPKLKDIEIKKVNNHKFTRMYFKHPERLKKKFHIDFKFGFPSLNFYHGINWTEYMLPNNIGTFQKEIEKLWNKVIGLDPDCKVTADPLQHISRKDHRSMTICGIYKHMLPQIEDESINSPTFMNYFNYLQNLYILKDVCSICKTLKPSVN